MIRNEKVIDYFPWMQRSTLGYGLQWMRILETGCKCQTAEGIVLWKHLPAAIRYQDTLLTSPLIFCSASILCSSLSLSCFDFSWIYLETGTLLLKNIKRASRTDCKLFVFIQHSCRNGPCLSDFRQGSCFSDTICA